jgi:HNH endonuclease
MALVITTQMAEAAAQRFWAKVQIGAGCWEWQAGKDWDGYGTIKVKSETLKRSVGAHRVSYVLHFGEIPPGMIVRHTCDNPSCVNPGHLLLGTTADNMADKVRRGRLPDQRGEKNPHNKLKEETVRQIFALASGPSPPRQRDIAAQFGVCQMTVSLIKQRKIWAHVT